MNSRHLSNIYLSVFHVFCMCIIVVFGSCQQPVHRAEAPHPALVSIDSMMWNQPDSAFAQLQVFASGNDLDSLGPGDEHYFQLLLSELLYKNDYAQTNRPALLGAVEYYDSLVSAGSRVLEPIAFLDARAHYINGVGYYELDSVVEACREYLKALEVMEDRFGEKDLVGRKAQFMALTNNRLGDLCSEQFMMETAITCYENALFFCKIEPTSKQGVTNILCHIGKQYYKKDDPNNAIIYFDNSLKYLSNTENLVYRDIVTYQALCEYQLGFGPELPLNELREIVRKTDDEHEKLRRYLGIGAIFFQEGLYDSVLFYYDPVYENDEDVMLQVRAAECLRIVYDSLGESEKANDCIRFLAEHKNSEGECKVLVSKIKDLFQNYMGLKQNKRLIQEKRDSIWKVSKILIFISIIIGAVSLFMMKRTNVNRLKEMDESHSIKQAAMSGRLKKSQNELNALRRELQQQKKNNSEKKQNGHANCFAEEPICILIQKRVKEGQFKSKVDYLYYKNYALDKQQLLELRTAADYLLAFIPQGSKKTTLNSPMQILIIAVFICSV